VWNFTRRKGSEVFVSPEPFSVINLPTSRAKMHNLSRHQTTLPEINTWSALVKVRLVDSSDAAPGEENSDERWIVAAGPVLNGKD
jgi:hypothetical protein